MLKYFFFSSYHFSVVPLVFDGVDEIPTMMNLKMRWFCREFCQHQTTIEVDSHFKQILIIEATVNDAQDSLQIKNIPVQLRDIMRNSFGISSVISLQSGHFTSLSMKADGKFILYDDQKRAPEEIDKNFVVCPQIIAYNHEGREEN